MSIYWSHYDSITHGMQICTHHARHSLHWNLFKASLLTFYLFTLQIFSVRNTQCHLKGHTLQKPLPLSESRWCVTSHWVQLPTRHRCAPHEEVKMWSQEEKCCDSVPISVKWSTPNGLLLFLLIIHTESGKQGNQNLCCIQIKNYYIWI